MSINRDASAGQGPDSVRTTGAHRFNGNWDRAEGMRRADRVQPGRFGRKRWEGAPSLRHTEAERAMFRTIDITIAAFAILLFLPLLVLLFAIVSIDSRGAFLFVQRRVGREGILFPCLKVRTMYVDADAVLARLLESDAVARAEWDSDFKLRVDPRITPVGRVLRKISLDELPQLFNVLAGHMSIVGPRPIVPAEIDRYGAFFGDYCSVRPGLTGLWQVSGRNDVSYAERVRLDARYALAKTVTFDLMIMLRTVPAVLGARGSY